MEQASERAARLSGPGLMSWVKLDDARAIHPKLRRAGFAARGLDEAAICLSSMEHTDGFVSDEMLRVLMAAHGERQPKRLVDLLLREERWERDDERGGYVIHGYLDYNPSAAEWEALSVERSQAGRASARARAPASVSTSVEQVLDTSRARVQPSRPVPSREAETLFTEFWAVYPRRVGKRAAQTTFAQACRRTDPEKIIAGAQRLATDPNLPRDEPMFIPHPKTWLNRDGWDDDPLPSRSNGHAKLSGPPPRPRPNTCVKCGDSLEEGFTGPPNSPCCLREECRYG